MSSLLSRGIAATRALLGLPPIEDELPTTPLRGARILGMPPVRSSPVAGAAITFRYRIDNPSGTTAPGDFRLSCILPDGTKYDLSKQHDTVVLALPYNVLGMSSPVRLVFPNDYEDAAGDIQPLYSLSVSLYHERYDGTEGHVTLAGNQEFSTPSFSILNERGTHRSVRFFANAKLSASDAYDRTYDPLVILVPKRP